MRQRPMHGSRGSFTLIERAGIFYLVDEFGLECQKGRAKLASSISLRPSLVNRPEQLLPSLVHGAIQNTRPGS